MTDPAKTDPAKPQATIPYLTIKGAAEAIDFYKKAFGAHENQRMAAQDGKRIMHACLSFNGGSVFLSDEFLEYAEQGAIGAPSKDNPAPSAIAINYETPAEVDAIYKRAVDAGCKGMMPPSDMFWDARFAQVFDPFGYRWMFNAPLPPKK